MSYASERATPPVTVLCASHSAQTKSHCPRFPPILPPPPAAHMPPTLPTRPPSALPSGTNRDGSSQFFSLVSNVSCQRQTNEPPSQFFFRSSGTLKIKVTPNVPSLLASPPPLPAPSSFMIKQPESHNAPKAQETLQTQNITTDDTNNVLSKTLAAEENVVMKPISATDKKDYTNYLIKVSTKAQNGECVQQYALTPAGQELVQKRSKIGWIFKKKV